MYLLPMLDHLQLLCNNPQAKTKNIETEFEMQLHEQYAINANHNLATMITIAIAALSVIGVFGYVLIHTNLSCFSIFIIGSQSESYTINTLLLSCCAVLIVLCILFHISLELGSKQRMEQFITFAIRCKYYDRKDYDDIFPEGYNPFNKCVCDFVQGLHNMSLKVYGFLYAIVVVITVVAYCIAKGSNECCCPCFNTGDANCGILCAFVVTIFFTLLISICELQCKYYKYLKRQKEYLEKESTKIIYSKEIDKDICSKIQKQENCRLFRCICKLRCESLDNKDKSKA